MLGPDDEVRIERPCRAGVRPLPVELVQEAFDEVERRVGLDRVLAGAQPREGGQRGRRERGQCASIGLVDAGSARRMVITAGGTGAVASR